VNPTWCLQCQAKPQVGESKFCSAECRAEFAKDMAEAIACSLCDAQVDGIAQATEEGWTEIDADPEGTSWNYLALCPACKAEEARR
jgi:hypothetical protein